MIWHIFRKDLRLLWPYVAGLVVLHLVDATMVVRLGIFDEPETLHLARPLFGILIDAVTALTIVLAVHQEAPAGTRHDWLARPMPPLAVLAAKLLFVVLAIRGPQFLIALALGASHGLSAGEVVGGALAQFVLGVPTDLTMLIVASLTGTLLEAIIGLVLVWGIGRAGLLMGLSRGLDGMTMVYWVMTLFELGIVLVGAAILLPLQYLRRKTWVLRGVFAAGVLAVALLPLLPVEAGHAVQQAFWADEGAAGEVTIAFDPALGRLGTPHPPSSRYPEPFFYLPVHVSGLPRDSMLITQHLAYTLTDRQGNVVYQGPRYQPFAQLTNMSGDASLQLRLKPEDRGEVRLHQSFGLPNDFLDRFRDVPVRLHVTYDLILLQRGETFSFPAIGGYGVLPQLGTCASRRVLTYDNQVGIWCFANSSTAADCFIDTIARRDNPAIANETSDECYAVALQEPLLFRLARGSEPGRQKVVYGFTPYCRHLGKCELPITLDQAAEAQFVLTSYKPVAFFRREMETPFIKPSEWGMKPCHGCSNILSDAVMTKTRRYPT
jgi:hypothetical protein